MLLQRNGFDGTMLVRGMNDELLSRSLYNSLVQVLHQHGQVKQRLSQIQMQPSAEQALRDKESQVQDTLRQVAVLRERCRQSDESVEREKINSARLKGEIALLKQDSERSDERAQAIIEKVVGHPGNKRPLPASKEVMDIVNYYETRLQQATDDLETVKRSSVNSYIPGPPAPQRSNQPDPLIVRNDPHPAGIDRLQNELSQAGTQSFERVRKAMSLEIQSLKQELAATKDALEDAEETSELMKLKMLAADNLKADSGDLAERRGVSTHDLVSQDKKRHKMKQMHVDTLEGAEAKEMISEICSKLDINSIGNLLHHLDDIVRTIGIVPEMQTYIRKLDVVVWGAPRLFEAVSAANVAQGSQDNLSLPKAPHKLDETLSKITQWRRQLDNDMKQLLQFKQSILHSLRIDDDPEVPIESQIKKVVYEIRKLSTSHQPMHAHAVDNGTSKFLTHFKDVFEVRNEEEIIPKLNDIFVALSEMRRWGKRYQKILSSNVGDGVDMNGFEVMERDDAFQHAFEFIRERKGTYDAAQDLDDAQVDDTASVYDLTLSALDALIGKNKQ